MIEAHGLARTFQARSGPVEAVRGVDFHVAKEEIVGFLGPNGAGKTTTQRMLATLLTPTSGEARVAGCDLRRDPVGVRRRIGYVAQEHSLNPSATVAEELRLQAQLYGVPRADADRRATELYEMLELTGLADRKTGTLSGGQRRRLDIALGLVHRPSLVFLDEPTTGLDPQSRANLWQHVRHLRDERGAAVFLTTHYLEEADALCDRILIIDQGRIVAEGTPDALKRRISGDLVTLAVRGPVERARELLVGTPGVRDVTVLDGAVRATVDRGAEQGPSLFRALESSGISVESFAMSRPSLDDVFLTLTGHSLRETND